MIASIIYNEVLAGESYQVLEWYSELTFCHSDHRSASICCEQSQLAYLDCGIPSFAPARNQSNGELSAHT